jgi:hypothetical protein
MCAAGVADAPVLSRVNAVVESHPQQDSMTLKGELLYEQ